MGSNQGNYSQQINTALNQANQPKSALSQQLSGTLQTSAGNILGQLANAGSLGNAFPGYSSGSSTPGMIQNQGLGNTIMQNSNNVANSMNYGASQAANNTGVSNSGSTSGPSSANNALNPYIPGYSGGFTPIYQNVQGTDLSSYLGKNLTFQDLINQGVLTQDQVNKQFNYDPSQPNTAMTQGPNGLVPATNYQQIVNSNSVDSLGANDSNGLESALASMGSYNTSGANGQTGPTEYLQNGVYTDGNGNVIGYQPNSAQQNGQGGGGANFNAIPNYGYSSASGSSNGMIQPTQQANPSGLQNMNLSGLNPQMLQQLIQQISAPSVSNYNPSQDLLNSGALQPGTVGAATANIDSSDFNPQDDAYYQATQQVLQNQLDSQRADLNARFDLSGNGRGTPGAYANAQFDAQALPAMASALGNVRQTEFANQLQQRGLAQQGNLANAASINQASLANQSTNTQFQALLAQLANQSGAQNLGQNQLSSQNQLAAAGLNSQNANLGLQAQLQSQQNQNSAINNQNTLLSQLSQFNAGQTNQANQTYAQMAQTANQAQIQNQFTGLQNLAQILSQFGLAGIPGGSANVSLGGQSQSPLQQLAGLGL